jgi:hypothetical protein
MALEYISGNVISQNVLGVEMKTDPSGIGTYNSNMIIPLNNRGYNQVHLMHGVTLDNLKEWNSQGFVSILNIWWDNDHYSGHFVVVTGYEDRGIIVNDPYPTPKEGTGRRQPYSRSTGKDAFISNQLLANLWSVYNHTALMIPYVGFNASTSASTTRTTTGWNGMWWLTNSNIPSASLNNIGPQVYDITRYHIHILTLTTRSFSVTMPTSDS